MPDLAQGFSEDQQPLYSPSPPADPPRAFVDLGKAGRFVIPAAMRAAMGVGESDRLVVTLEGGALRVESQKSVIAHVQAALRPLAKPGQSVVDELIASRRREAERA